MKKKIILFLSVLLVATFLTGCVQSVSKVEIETMNNIANEVAENGMGYILPDGYTISYSDSKNTSRFIITTKGEHKNIIKGYYRISDGKAELEEIFTEDEGSYWLDILILIAFLIGVVIVA